MTTQIKTMKAALCTGYGAPEVLEISDVRRPTPKAHEVCVKLRATAVTASDTIVRGRKIPLWQPVGFMMSLVIGITKPRNPILGMVFSGEVVSIGEKVQSFDVGDPVYGMTGPEFGAYAEYLCISEKGCLSKKPSCMSDEEAAAITYGGLIASHFLEKGALAQRKKVLIYGASGAIGTAALQLAKCAGAKVTGVCSTKHLELVRSLGAEEVIDYTKEDVLPDGVSYDLVLDAVGRKKTSTLKTQCRKALTKDGRYLSVDDGMPISRPAYLHKLSTLVELGQYRAVVDRVYSLDEIVEAHKYVDKGHKKGNVVVTFVE